MIESEKSSGATKHVDVKFHVVREHYQNKTMLPRPRTTDLMHADTLTKALPQGPFQYHRKALGVVPV